MTLNRTAWLSGAILVTAAVAQAGQYTITGILRTPIDAAHGTVSDKPLERTMVILRSSAGSAEYVHETAWTGTDGSFQIVFTATGPVDTYLNVRYLGRPPDETWPFAIELRASNADADLIEETLAHLNRIAPGVYSLGTADRPGDPTRYLRARTARGVVINQIRRAMNTIRTNCATWAMPRFLRVEVRSLQPDPQLSFTAGNGSFISIARGAWEPAGGSSDLSDIHHEFFHWAAYFAYGERWPQPEGAAGSPWLTRHTVGTESATGFALQEGSAEYFARLSAFMDNKNGLPGANIWRGDDGSAWLIGTTVARHGGDIVEGALFRTFAGLEKTSTLCAFLTGDSAKRPDHIQEFRELYLESKKSDAAAQRMFFSVAAWEGMPLTRAWIDHFESPSGVPNTAPSPAGNHRVIAGLQYVRGTVNANLLNSPGNGAHGLQLANETQIEAPTKVNLAFKTANNGLADDPNSFVFAAAREKPYTSSPLLFPWVTPADGEYDLLVQATNKYGWSDLFEPDYTGDGTAEVSTNERLLKFTGTWFVQPAQPFASDNAGKVIVDNTAPVATGFKPQ